VLSGYFPNQMSTRVKTEGRYKTKQAGKQPAASALADENV